MATFLHFNKRTYFQSDLNDCPEAWGALSKGTTRMPQVLVQDRGWDCSKQTESWQKYEYFSSVSKSWKPLGQSLSLLQLIVPSALRQKTPFTDDLLPEHVAVPEANLISVLDWSLKSEPIDPSAAILVRGCFDTKSVPGVSIWAAWTSW